MPITRYFSNCSALVLASVAALACSCTPSVDHAKENEITPFFRENIRAVLDVTYPPSEAGVWPTMIISIEDQYVLEIRDKNHDGKPDHWTLLEAGNRRQEIWCSDGATLPDWARVFDENGTPIGTTTWKHIGEEEANAYADQMLKEMRTDETEQ